MEGSPEASGSKSNTHCSGLAKSPVKGIWLFFPLVPTSHKGWVVGTKWHSLKIYMKVSKKLLVIVCSLTLCYDAKISGTYFFTFTF